MTLDEANERLREEGLHEFNVSAMNSAMWAACNVRYAEGGVSSMEDASQAAIQAVVAYLVAVAP